MASARVLTSGQSRRQTPSPLLSRGLDAAAAGHDRATATMNPMHATPMTNCHNPVRTMPPLRVVHGDPADDIQQAWMAEYVRIQHIQKALACTRNRQLRERWQAELAGSRVRMQGLEQSLCCIERPTDRVQTGADVLTDECLLHAMELARANGDLAAAEAVAVECMALVELRCLRIRHGRARPAAQAIVDAGHGGICKERDQA